MSISMDKQFGKIRSTIWPIHGREYKKLLPMLVMVFLVCFNYSILRTVKDTVVVTASGAEVIPFIKVWALLPMAILLTCLFTFLSNRYSQERVFYLIISGYLIFFAIFAFVLYPAREFIHPNAMADYAEKILPAGAKGFISMWRNWSFTLFYVISELWGSLVLGVLFWGFANEVTKLTEARRFYSVLGVVSNVAAIIAGRISKYLSSPVSIFPGLSPHEGSWEQTLMILVSVILCSGIIAMLTFRWMNKNVLNDPEFDDLHSIKKNLKKEKKKLSVKESISYLSNSKYLVCIATIVLTYNLVINLVEVIWKDQVRALYTTPAEYNSYMSDVTSMIGILSTLTALFMSSIIKRLGWTKTAMITPVIMLITSVGFFSFLFLKDSLAGLAIFHSAAPLAIVVFFGGAQNSLSKAAKYSVFDATKEMAFIPLSHECKLKGKAAIDGVGSRLGKSGGSFIHQGLLMMFGTISAIAPYVAGIFLIMIILWFIATSTLGKQFDALVASQTAEKLPVREDGESDTDKELEPALA